MPVPQHRDPRQRLPPILSLPITAYDKRAVRVPFAAYAHASGVRLEDPRLEMSLDGPGVECLFEGFESWEFLAQMQRRHFNDDNVGQTRGRR